MIAADSCVLSCLRAEEKVNLAIYSSGSRIKPLPEKKGHFCPTCAMSSNCIHWHIGLLCGRNTSSKLTKPRGGLFSKPTALTSDTKQNVKNMTSRQLVTARKPVKWGEPPDVCRYPGLQCPRYFVVFQLFVKAKGDVK